MTTETNIKEIITPVLEQNGYDLVRVLVTGKELKTVQIMLERKDLKDMSIEDCSSISRDLSVLFTVEDPFSEKYILEISSPGIDRPLVKKQDYDRFKGREVKIETSISIEGRKRFKGLLKGLSGDQEKVEIIFEETSISIPYDQIIKAKLLLPEDLLKKKTK